MLAAVGDAGRVGREGEGLVFGAPAPSFWRRGSVGCSNLKRHLVSMYSRGCFDPGWLLGSVMAKSWKGVKAECNIRFPPEEARR